MILMGSSPSEHLEEQASGPADISAMNDMTEVPAGSDLDEAPQEHTTKPVPESAPAISIHVITDDDPVTQR